MPTIDTVKSFGKYAKIQKTRMYELIHADGFPCFRTAGDRGRVLIEREAAIEWLKTKSREPVIGTGTDGRIQQFNELVGKARAQMEGGQAYGKR